MYDAGLKPVLYARSLSYRCQLLLLYVWFVYLVRVLVFVFMSVFVLGHDITIPSIRRIYVCIVLDITVRVWEG